MRTVSVWLIHNKASLDPCSPINLDGSTSIIGIGIVPASDISHALELFDDFLQDQQMRVLEIWKCEQYLSENFVDSTQDNREIKEASAQALEESKIFYVCGVSSETLTSMERDDLSKKYEV